MVGCWGYLCSNIRKSLQLKVSITPRKGHAINGCQWLSVLLSNNCGPNVIYTQVFQHHITFNYPLPSPGPAKNTSWPWFLARHLERIDRVLYCSSATPRNQCIPRLDRVVSMHNKVRYNFLLSYFFLFFLKNLRRWENGSHSRSHRNEPFASYEMNTRLMSGRETRMEESLLLGLIYFSFIGCKKFIVFGMVSDLLPVWGCCNSFPLTNNTQ